MAFADLVKARDDAIVIDDDCAAAQIAAEAAHAEAVAQHVASSEARAAAHKAIHDLLVERGEHYLIDEAGSLTVYKPIDAEPGYLAVQPIPGTGPAASESKKK